MVSLAVCRKSSFVSIYPFILFHFLFFSSPPLEKSLSEVTDVARVVKNIVAIGAKLNRDYGNYGALSDCYLNLVT